MSDAFPWPWTNLGSVLAFHGSGATPRGGKDTYKNDGLPLVRSMNVYDLRFDEGDLAFIDGEQAADLERVSIKADDVLLNITGASVARCCLAPLDVVGGRVNQHVMILRVELSVAEPRFVAPALAGPYKTKLLSIAGSGATREALTKSDVEMFEISLPPVETQRAIARTLDVYAALIENNRRRIEILEETARLIYREWFVHFRFPGHEDVELVDSELGPIPEGWAVTPLEHLQADTPNATAAGPFGSKLGRSDYVDEPGVPVIRGANLKLGGGFLDEGFVYVSDAKAEKLRSSLTSAGDVVVTQRGTLGQVGLIPNQSAHEFYVLSQSQMKFTADVDRVDPLLVYMQLASPDGIQRIQDIATGSGVPHINLSMFRELKFLVPPRLTQSQFAETVAPMRQLSTSLTRQNSVLAAARDLLLPRLIAGELDVSDLDLDLDSVA